MDFFFKKKGRLSVGVRMLRFFKGSKEVAVVDVEQLVPNKLFQGEEENPTRMLKIKDLISDR
jgi:hypothetical protein